MRNYTGIQTMTMRVTLKGFLSWIVGFIGLVALLIMVLIDWNQHINATGRSQSTTTRPHNIVSQMVDYAKAGRYDDAVQIGLQSLHGGPTDGAIYQQIVDINLIRAQKESGQREQWVGSAVSYADKAMSSISLGEDLAGVQRFQVARSFELAGDLSTTGRCAYYERARKLLEDRISLLKGDQLTLEGKTFQLAPLRNENARVLAEVRGKAANAGCK